MPTRVEKSQTGEWLVVALYVLAIAGYPFVAAMSSITDFDNRLISIAFRFLLCVLCCVLAINILTNRLGVSGGLTWLPLIAFWALYFFQLAIEMSVDTVYLSRPPFEYWLFAIFGAFFPMLVAHAKLSDEAINFALKSALIFTAIVAALILIGAIVELLRGTSSVFITARLSIQGLNPIAVGHVGGSLVILAFCSLRQPNSEENVLSFTPLTYCAIAGLLGGILLFASASKGPILSVAAAFGLIPLLMIGREGGFRWIIAFVVVVFIGVCSAFAIEQYSDFNPIYRIIEAGSDRSASLRETLYAGAIDQFSESPFFGGDIEERTLRFYPHNLILEALMATGVFGGMFFLTIIGLALYRAAEVFRHQRYELWIAMLFIQYLVGSMFSGSLYSSGTMWILLGALLSRRTWLTS